MHRRAFLTLAAALRAAGQSLPSGPALAEPHFPSRLHTFLFRNWELANTSTLAKLLQTSEKNILALGRSMGLPPKPHLSPDQLRRIYITVIRQNWHLLPPTQIIQLLGWDLEKYEFTLKEDDFLDVKLARQKPACEPLAWHDPTPAERRRATEIRQTLHHHFGPALHAPGEPPFQFIQRLSTTSYPRIQTTAPLAPSAIPLTRFTIAPPADPALSPLAARLSRYLLDTFQTRVPVAASPREIRLLIAPAMRLHATPDSIEIAAPNPAAIAQLITRLQDEMEAAEAPAIQPANQSFSELWNPRYLYSYFALYGDPLLDTSTDPFPNGYLEKLARAGINGVWLQGVLNTLAPSKTFPEFGVSSDIRLRNLDALCRRAAQFGIQILLYMNEPRAMPAAFFQNRPHLRGAHFQGLYSLCTSQQQVRDWLSDSLAHVFHHAPQLGGIFTISSSENHTNCFSHGGSWGKPAPTVKDCPRCSQRQSWLVFAEMFKAMRDGVRRSSATARIIHWDWGWTEDLAANLIPLLDKDVTYSSISEWSQPVDRGGVQSQVGEYSISVNGPGPRASRNWTIARNAGLNTLAKVQFNNTWEISAVPFIPVPNLILEHCAGLRRAGVSGLMISWTCGGYPSLNLHAAKSYYLGGQPDHTRVLRQLAAQRFGPASIDDAVRAWDLFSSAFREFPYGVSIYLIPTQHGPANLLRLQPSGQKPGMILYPHDLLDAWRGRYPAATVESQFRKLCAQWRQGLDSLRKAAAKASKKHTAAEDLAIAETCLHHFESVANQVEFYRLRNSPQPDRNRLRQLALDELTLARAQYPIARAHSIIAYEATNHYYYRPLDLAEKVLNCAWIAANA